MQIPDLTLTSGDIVSTKDVYERLFKPHSSGTSLEILNGGLNNENYSGGIGSIEPYMCQYGSFAMGYFSGFNQTHKVYGTTLSANTATSEPQMIIHSDLSSSVYLPWAPKMLLFGYQGFFQHDATVWDNDGTRSIEDWEIRLFRRDSNGTAGFPAGMKAKLPWGRAVDITQYDTDETYVNPLHEQNRWRYVNKHKVITNAEAGYHDFEIQIYSGINYPDRFKQKVKTVVGGFFMLAIR